MDGPAYGQNKHTTNEIFDFQSRALLLYCTWKLNAIPFPACQRYLLKSCSSATRFSSLFRSWVTSAKRFCSSSRSACSLLHWDWTKFLSCWTSWDLFWDSLKSCSSSASCNRQKRLVTVLKEAFQAYGPVINSWCRRKSKHLTIIWRVLTFNRGYFIEALPAKTKRSNNLPAARKCFKYPLTFPDKLQSSKYKEKTIHILRYWMVLYLLQCLLQRFQQIKL